MVEVRLFATLRQGREKSYQFEDGQAPDGAAILETLGIRQDEVKIFLINGHHSDLSAPIEEGDVISVFPAVGGG
ncbi:MAG: MoaD/ThiS family protein [Actinomycetia bacterium]|nr:MoaD/ThiS family protein [Actinomycetes bacterium]